MAYNTYKDVKPQEGRQKDTFEMIKRGEVDFLLYGGARGAGKSLVLQELILTDKGFKKNEDLTLDDKVIDPVTGKAIKILQLHPIEELPVYRVHFEDGGIVECNKDHLWPAWKLNRKERTTSKDVNGNTVILNYTTGTLKEWCDKAENNKRKEYPAIPLTAPTYFDNGYTPLVDPYLLGLLLGDGCISKSGKISIASEDEYILDYCKNSGMNMYNIKYSKANDMYFVGEARKKIIKALTSLKLLGTYSHTKFIPEEYLNASYEVRLALLQGLMDTDGSLECGNQMTYSTVSKDLAKGVKFLINSLGGVCNIREYIDYYVKPDGEKVYCKKCYKFYIKHPKGNLLFRLERKSSRFKPQQNYYKKIINIEVCAPKKMRCITVGSKEGLFITGKDFYVTHNSELMTMVPLIFNHDKHFRGIFFRRQYDELMGGGGLWQKAEGMYPLFNAKANISSKTWTFPSGAKQEFRHMYTEGDKESYRGKGFSFVAMDEINQFSKEQVTFLMTCLRSEAKMDSFLMGSMNPAVDSWVLPLVEWYLLENGNPDPDKIGKIRYFIVKDGDFVFGDSEEYFQENYPDSVYVTNRIDGSELYIRPKRFTFVSANIFDNPALIAANPAYLSELQNLPEHERDRELWGNWYARAKGSNYFQRQWLHKATKIPEGSVCVRAVDKAYTEPSEKNRYPDYTATIKMSKCPDGEYYISGDWNPDLRDPPKHNADEVIGRYRVRAGQRNQWLLRQAAWDGEEVTQVIPEESGAGVAEFTEMVKMYTEAGYNVTGAKTGNAKGAKMKRFSTFASACQNGLVHILEDTFYNQATLNAFYKELESFTGEGSTATIHDDWVDCCSDAFNSLQKQHIFTVPNIPKINAPTRLHTMKSSTRR